MDDLKLYAENDDNLEGQPNTLKRFSDDIRMQFDLDVKFDVKVTFKKGLQVKSKNITIDINTEIT